MPGHLTALFSISKSGLAVSAMTTVAVGAVLTVQATPPSAAQGASAQSLGEPRPPVHSTHWLPGFGLTPSLGSRSATPSPSATPAPASPAPTPTAAAAPAPAPSTLRRELTRSNAAGVLAELAAHSGEAVARATTKPTAKPVAKPVSKAPATPKPHASQPAPVQPAPPAAQLPSLPALAQAMLSRLNADRAANGIAPLSLSGSLVAAAHAHNLAMAAANSMSHQVAGEASLSGRLSAAGYGARAMAENIGWTTNNSQAGALGLDNAMMAEVAPNDGHRVNILNATYTQVGIDVLYDAATGKLWLTEDFGAPR